MACEKRDCQNDPFSHRADIARRAEGVKRTAVLVLGISVPVALIRFYVRKFYYFRPLRRFGSHVSAELCRGDDKRSDHQFSKPRVDGWVL